MVRFSLIFIKHFLVEIQPKVVTVHNYDQRKIKMRESRELIGHDKICLSKLFSNNLVVETEVM